MRNLSDGLISDPPLLYIGETVKKARTKAHFRCGKKPQFSIILVK